MSTRLRTMLAMLVAFIALAIATDAPRAQKLSHRAKSLFEEKYKGKTLQLRIDLRPVEPYVGTQFVDKSGVHYPNFKQSVVFGRLEKVAIDMVGNLGGNFWIGIVTRAGAFNRASNAELIQGLLNPSHVPGSEIDKVPAASIELRIGKGVEPLSPVEELEAAEDLLKRVFYIDAVPTATEVEAFVLEHFDYPIEALRDLTGLDEGQIAQIKEKGKFHSNHE